MDVKIQKTTNYQKFRLVEGNRAINPANLSHIIKSIQTKDLLMYAPILVNGKGEIIDGQHRLAAAKKLKKEIYYMVVPEATIEDVQLLNANHKAWQSRDYLDSYITMKKHDYIILREYMNAFDFPVSVAVMLLSRERHARHTLMDNFRNGTFKVVDLNYAKEMGERILHLRKYASRRITRDRDFLTALHKVLDIVDFEKLYQKIEKNDQLIRKEDSPAQYLKQLEEIYNKGNKQLVRFWGEK